MQGQFIHDFIITPQKNSISSPQIQLSLREIAFSGTMGPKFQITLCNTFAEEWESNLGFKQTGTRQHERKILIFQLSTKPLSYMCKDSFIPILAFILSIFQ